MTSQSDLWWGVMQNTVLPYVKLEISMRFSFIFILFIQTKKATQYETRLVTRLKLINSNWQGNDQHIQSIVLYKVNVLFCYI